MYNSFKVDQEGPYRLHVSGYDDVLSTAQDALAVQNGMAFSTMGHDNDIWSANCAAACLGAWWYSNCHDSNLNGYNYKRGDQPGYCKGIIWTNTVNNAEHGDYFSWPAVKMMIRRML